MTVITRWRRSNVPVFRLSRQQIPRHALHRRHCHCLRCVCGTCAVGSYQTAASANTPCTTCEVCPAGIFICVNSASARHQQTAVVAGAQHQPSAQRAPAFPERHSHSSKGYACQRVHLERTARRLCLETTDMNATQPARVATAMFQVRACLAKTAVFQARACLARS
jgi:hypothetical protein